LRKRIILLIQGLLLLSPVSGPYVVYASADGQDGLPSVGGLMQDMADKAFKNMKPEDIPYFRNDVNADCSKFVTTSIKKFAKLETLIVELGEAKKANRLGVWDKIKAGDAIRIILGYAVVDRMFAAKRCVDGFEATAFPKIERLLDQYENMVKH